MVEYRRHGTVGLGLLSLFFCLILSARCHERIVMYARKELLELKALATSPTNVRLTYDPSWFETNKIRGSRGGSRRHLYMPSLRQGNKANVCYSFSSSPGLIPVINSHQQPTSNRPTISEPPSRPKTVRNCVNVAINKTPPNKPKTTDLLPNVLLTNCRSLSKNKLEELKTLIIEENSDVIMLTETWLNNTKDSVLSVDGFKTWTCHRQNRIGGGVAALTCSSLAFTKVESYTSPTVSTIWLKHKRPSQKPIIYCCLYHPPSASDDITINHLVDYVKKLSIKHKTENFMICGDFNRLDISVFTECFNMKQLVNFPTRGDATLDLILTNIPEYTKSACEKLPPLETNDHCCVSITGARKCNRIYTTIRKRSMGTQNRQDLLVDIIKHDWTHLLEAPTVDKKVEIYHTDILALLDTHCPVKNTRIRADNPPWETDTTRKLRAAKKKAYDKNCPTWKYFANTLKKITNSNKRKYFKSMASSGRWWDIVKTAEGKVTYKIPKQFYFIDDAILTETQFVLNLNEYFTSVGGNRLENNPVVYDLPDDSTLQMPSVGHVKQKMKKLNAKKATNSNDFPTWISVQGAEDLCIPLHDILCCMLASRQFPRKWKQAEVVPLEKTPSPTSFSDYRPISLLYHSGKIAESIIMELYKRQVLPHIEPNQYAYLQHLSTTDALIKIFDDWTRYLDDSNVQCVRTMFADFSKAFDRMQPETLLQKLQDMNVTPCMLHLINDFLSSRSQCVRIGKSTSPLQNITVGTPQGTISGPMLWIAFANDLEANIPTIKYADDTTCYTAIPKSIILSENHEIQDAASYCQDWSSKNQMTLNAKKTKTMTITLKAANYTPARTFISDVELEDVTTFKLLGVIVDHHLTFQHHAETIISKARRTSYSIIVLKRQGLDTTTLLNVYISRIRSILTYAAPAWFSLINKKLRDKIIGVEKLCIKIILPERNTYEERLSDLGIKSITDFVDSLCLKLLQRIEGTPGHPLHQTLVNMCRSSSGPNTRSREKYSYVPDKSRTTTRANAFLNYTLRKKMI